jgi:predicted ATPase/DNA-binding SARP family transcriptional activator
MTRSTPHGAPGRPGGRSAPLIGRDALLRTLRRQLHERRLVTLTGPPGVGKSALAARLAGDAGVWCDLGPVADPGLVTVAAALAVGLEDAGPAVVDALAGALRGHHGVLVLDGCEHVSSGAADLAAHLLEACPDLAVVATSRLPLGLEGEHVVRVPTLSTVGATSPAMRLFAARAAAVRPGFALGPGNAGAVATICHEVGGLPLAIELAAARVALLEPGQIADRLGDLLTGGTARNAGLAAALEWSLALLDPASRAALQHLSVLPGPFALDTAEAVVDSDRPVLDVLDALHASSWLVVDPGADSSGRRRYRLLEPVRQHARSELAATGGGDRARTRLLEHCLRAASAATARLTGPDRAAARALLTDDIEHHRASLRWAVERGLRSQGLGLACALWRYWMDVGLLAAEGRSSLEQLLALDGPIDAALWSESLARAGSLAWRTGDFVGAIELGRRALEVAEGAADPTAIARAANLLGVVETDLGDFEQALRHQQRALAVNRAAADGYGAAVALANVGVALRYLGRFAEAAATYQEGMAAARAVGADTTLDTFNLGELALVMGDLGRARELVEASLATTAETDTYQRALATQALGQIARRAGHLDEARRWFEESLARRRAAGDQTKASYSLVHLAETALDAGDTAAAARHLRAAAVAGTVDPWGQALALSARGRLAMRTGDPVGASALLRQSLAVLHHTDPLGQVTVLERLAEATAASGDSGTAVRWWAAASAARTAMQAPRWPADTLAGGLGEVREPPVTLAAAVAEALADGDSEAGRPAAPAPVVVVRALGRPEVEVSGRPVGRTAWTYTKARELFFYLLEHPPATRAEIGLALWPDASPEGLRSIFHRVNHALRRALGRSDVVVHADGRYGVSWTLVAYDAAAFDAVHARCADLDRLAPAERLQLAADLEAVLWEGDYLDGMDGGEWLLLRREDLARRRLDAMMTIGAIHVGAGDHYTAARWYTRVIALDRLAEEAHRQLMRCHARLGERSRALEHVGRLAGMLREDLGAAPSPETVLLAERIQRGDDV